jgi:hypothetical protein
MLENDNIVLDGVEAGLRVIRPLLSGTVAKEDDIIVALKELTSARKIQQERIDRQEREAYRAEKIKQEYAPMRPTWEQQA